MREIATKVQERRRECYGNVTRREDDIKEKGLSADEVHDLAT